MALRVNAGELVPVVSGPTGFERRVVASVSVLWRRTVVPSGKLTGDISATWVLVIIFNVRILDLPKVFKSARVPEMVWQGVLSSIHNLESLPEPEMKSSSSGQ